MPAPTPFITLTATLLDYSGNAIGSAAQPAWLRIWLCGYGQTLPVVPGAGNIAKVSSPFLDVQFTGSVATVALWANSQITPTGTFYAIALLDTNKNVVQSGIYQFLQTGATNIDLSAATQIVQPPVPQIFSLAAKAVTGTTPGEVFTIPTTVWAGQVLGVFYRGSFYGTTNFTVSSQTLTMNFVCTEAPVAFYVQALGN